MIVDAVAPTPEMALKAAEKVRREVLEGGRGLALQANSEGVVEAVDLEYLLTARKGND